MTDPTQGVKCPICKGSGRIKAPKFQQKKSIRIIANRTMATLLKKEGYSLREIQKFLGYKSCRSAAVLLEKRTKK